MAEKRPTNKKTKAQRKKENRKSAILFWVSLIVFLVPFAVLGYIVISAAMDTGKPVIGSRYDNDHNPAITDSDISNVETAVSNVSGVEDSFANLATGTLRVYADISDTADVETAKSVANEVYNAVTNILNVNTYFSQSSGQKMYDLEIHVYNSDKNTDDDSFVYVVETLNSSMEEPVVQVLSEPIDAELAERLRQDVIDRNNPDSASEETATPEATASAEASE